MVYTTVKVGKHEIAASYHGAFGRREFKAMGYENYLVRRGFVDREEDIPKCWIDDVEIHKDKETGKIRYEWIHKREIEPNTAIEDAVKYFVRTGPYLYVVE